MTRKLSLRKETLAELTAEELESVVGMSGAPCNLTDSCLPTCRCTGYYPSLNAPCGLTVDVC